jgi:hypothetical protein
MLRLIVVHQIETEMQASALGIREKRKIERQPAIRQVDRVYISSVIGLVRLLAGEG